MLTGCGSDGELGHGPRHEPETVTEQHLPRAVKIMIPEGRTLYRVAKSLEESGVCSAADFIETVNSQSESNPFVFEIHNREERPFLLEGYLFPGAYEFYVGEPSQRALDRLLSNTQKKLTTEYYARALQLGYSMDQIITIASIIQTEVAIAAEMPFVASVLHNRLNSDNYLRKLQCDATYFYLRDHVYPFYRGDAEEVSEPLREKYDALYNTYRFNGLPAGPICNPGKDAIEAALYPAETDYYYFVTDAAGRYHYNNSYEAHVALCKRFGINSF